jgi:hypothetical protein
MCLFRLKILFIASTKKLTRFETTCATRFSTKESHELRLFSANSTSCPLWTIFIMVYTSLNMKKTRESKKTYHWLLMNEKAFSPKSYINVTHQANQCLWKSQDCPKTARKLLEDCPKAAWRLPEDCPKTARRLPEDCPKTAQKLHEDCPKTAQRLPKDCPKTAQRLPEWIDLCWYFFRLTSFPHLPQVSWHAALINL